MGWFSQDKSSVFKKQVAAAMKTALKDGTTQDLRAALNSIGDLPKSILAPALSTAIEKERLAPARMLLEAGAPWSDVHEAYLERIVANENIEMFKLLTQYGTDFSAYVHRYSTEAGRELYLQKVQLLRKTVDGLKLHEEIEAVKKEITEVKTQKEAPATKASRLPQL